MGRATRLQVRALDSGRDNLVRGRLLLTGVDPDGSRVANDPGNAREGVGSTLLSRVGLKVRANLYQFSLLFRREKR